MPLSVNQPTNQSTRSITSPQYSNLILVSRPHFFPLTNTVQDKNTCMRTYYTSSHPSPLQSYRVPPLRAQHRTPTNSANQPLRNHITSKAADNPTCLPAIPFGIPPRKGETKNDNGRPVAAGEEEKERRGKKPQFLTHYTRHIHTWT